ncbi:PadR family transcriptional regulator [Chitinimonas sp.]|uniref:PadR family transcriptional regulator n=1 Tax=Chitinimonas sp. TaxID=1934313 RepID=UPI0035B12D99
MRLNQQELEASLLILLQAGDCTHYAAAGAVLAHKLAPEAAIYPCLRQMLRRDWVSSYLVEQADGPPRKYFRLETRGRDALDRLAQSLAGRYAQIRARLLEPSA